jgi:small-conductance mechanosensitive channel
VKIVKLLWIALCIVVLCITLYFYDGKPNSDISDFLVWTMVLLTFPLGLIVSLLIGWISFLLYESTEVVTSVSYGMLFLVWLVYFIVGYFQWFKMTPAFSQKLRSRNRPGFPGDSDT